MKNSRRRWRLTKSQVLAWADAWRRQTGRYPTVQSGTVQPGLRLTWKAVDTSLRDGYHGLPGSNSLAQLLAQRRGVRNQSELPRLSEAVILHWADEHFRRTGRWPQYDGGPIEGEAGETWRNVQSALTNGYRGLRGGSSLARLLAAHGRKRNPSGLPPLTMEQILFWAEETARRTGSWPHVRSGPVLGAPGETWKGVNAALRDGRRGLPGGASLALLVRHYRSIKLYHDAEGWPWEGKVTAAQLTARLLGAAK
jgi:hypothetical protein